MPEMPWFKFWAQDFLTDGDVDALEDGAVVLLVRAWCLCCLEGSAPSDPERLARRTMRRFDADFLRHLKAIKPFFELRDGGRLYSKRMESERSKSVAAKESANARWNAERNAKRNAKTHAQSQKPELEPKPESKANLRGEGSEIATTAEPVETSENVEKSEIVPKRGSLRNVVENSEHRMPEAMDPQARRELLRKQIQNIQDGRMGRKGPTASLAHKATAATAT